jgi:hypothetical protein
LKGHLKKLFVPVAIAGVVCLAHSSQLALIVLNTATVGTGRLPSDWQMKVNHGKPDFSVCTDSDQPCVRLKSVKASFALERGVDIDPDQMPYLSWRWKVTQLPSGGDFRHVSTDDQAAQLLVLFADRHVLTYIWDSTAPKNTAQSASSVPLVHIFAIVCESGAAEMNRWIDEMHNLERDYQRAYGKMPPHVKGLRIQINSQHTGTVAESCFGDVAFRSTSQ